MADEGPPPDTILATNAPTAPDGSRDWEKPWTITEMRQGANNWSLSGDSRLLLYLQDFSQKMISRVHEIEKEVDGLMNESKLTSVRLNNVFNDFIMLANTQFVENRVYDEDVSQEDSAKSGDQQEEKEKTREEREAELIPRVKEALMLGIDVIDKAFDQLDSHAADSDSEDDDTAYRVDPILEAKDPYLNRPLPLMIGEPKFMEDDTVGLMEVESEGEESDVGSISESEDGDEKKPPLGSDDSSDEETDSEEESDEEKPVKKPAKKADSESEDESDGDLFDEKEEKSENDTEEEEEEEGEDEEEEEEEVEKKIPKPSGPGGFAAELAKKLGAPVPQGPADSEEEEEEEIVKPKAKKGKGGKKAEKKEERSDSKGKKGKKNKKQEDDEPFPADDEDDSPFGNKGGLFASKGGLFDDDDDDDGGLFDEVMGNKPKKKSVKEEEEEEENDDEEEEEVKVEKKPRKRTISGKKVPAGGVSIFGDDGDGLFGKKSSKQEAPEKPKAGGGGGLFDDEEDDLFSSPSENTPKPVKKEKEAVKTKPAGGLFEDEDDEDDLFSEAKTKKEENEERIQEVKKEEKKEKKKEKKPPPGAVPMFGGGMNPLAAAIKKRKPDSDEEDKEDWSDEEKPRSASVKSNQSASSINSKPILKPNKPSPSPSSNSLFDDDADDALFSAPAKPRADSKSKAKQTKSLFDDEGEDALFGSTAPKPTQPKKKEEKTKAGSLFDNEESDEGEDLFGVPAKTKDSEKKKPVGGVSLFGGADVLGVKPKQEEKITEKKQEAVKPKSPATNKLSLFDEDEEEDDLFGGGATPVKSGKTASAPLGKPMPKGKDLFEDEDLLFGENQGESPGVDIFSKSPPEAPKSDGQMDVEGATITESSDSKPEVPPEEPKPRKPVGGVSMFGGLDPMAALKKKEPKEPIAEEKPPAPTVKKEPPKKAVKPADSLFGDDEEEEDLFGGSSSKAVPSKPPPPKDDLFGSPKSDDDLFSPKPSQKPEEKKEEPAEIKPKKPAGAVSMFGGMDPFSAMKKKSSSVEDKEKEDKPYNEKPAKDNIFGSPKSDDDLFGSSPKQQVNQAEEKEESTEVKPRRPPGAVSMFGNVDPFAAMKKKSPSVEDTGDVSPKSPSTDDTNTTGKPTSKIGKLKMNIGINPAALLPGAAPPSKEPETTPVGFDTPAEAKTLHSANKDRAKIQTKRRPPSRRGRQTSSESVQPMLNGLSEESSAPVAASSLPDLPPLENDRVPSASTDLFGNDDLLGESVPSLMPQTQKSSGSQIADVFSKDKDDLFSSKRDKEKPSMTNDDLFGAVKTEGRTKSKHALPVDDDDDIFSSSSVKPKKATALESAIVNGGKDTKTEKSKESEKKSVLDDDDDIFAKPKKRATDFEKLFDKDAEDDKSKDISKKESKSNVEEEDIFADSSLSKKKESKVKKDEEAVEEEKKSSKADEDADDIFAVKTTKKVKARPKTKDEDLFKDDTDIFADVPAAKPKEKKKKKVAEKKTGIFKDDVDDIFADVSTPKAKKDKKKTETSKSKTKAIDVNDIFDDPLK